MDLLLELKLKPHSFINPDTKKKKLQNDFVGRLLQIFLHIDS